MIYLISNADDLGMSFAFNQGILQGVNKGILTSVSIRCNNPKSYQHAVSEVFPQIPHLGKGIHVCLNEGMTVRQYKHSSILSANGQFQHTFIKGFLFLAYSKNNRKLKEEVEAELRCQIETIMAHVSVDHLNSHQHVHAIPWIYDLLVQLSCEYRIPFIRNLEEPFVVNAVIHHPPAVPSIIHYLNLQRYVKIHKLRHPNAPRANIFLSSLHSGHMDESCTTDLLKSVIHSRKKKSISDDYYIEMLHHPAEGLFSDDELDHSKVGLAYLRHSGRQMELIALMSSALKKLISKENICLTHYGKITCKK